MMLNPVKSLGSSKAAGFASVLQTLARPPVLRRAHASPSAGRGPVVPGAGASALSLKRGLKRFCIPCPSPGAVPPARGRHGCSFVKWGFVKTARGLRAAAPGSVAARDRSAHVGHATREPDADE